MIISLKEEAEEVQDIRGEEGKGQRSKRIGKIVLLEVDIINNYNRSVRGESKSSNKTFRSSRRVCR
jgi:hypothetical protein